MGEPEPFLIFSGTVMNRPVLGATAILTKPPIVNMSFGRKCVRIPGIWLRSESTYAASGATVSEPMARMRLSAKYRMTSSVMPGTFAAYQSF
jgi:cyanate permease